MSKYTPEKKAEILSDYFTFYSHRSIAEASRILGVSKTTLHRWIKEAQDAPEVNIPAPAIDYTTPPAAVQHATTKRLDEHVIALSDGLHIESNRVHELTKRVDGLEQRVTNKAAHAFDRHATLKARVDALESSRAVPALAEAYTDLAARVGTLEADAQDDRKALYDARERLLELEARDTEDTPYEAVDRTYVLVIVILVITVAITLATLAL